MNVFKAQQQELHRNSSCVGALEGRQKEEIPSQSGRLFWSIWEQEVTGNGLSEAVCGATSGDTGRSEAPGGTSVFRLLTILTKMQTSL